MRRDSTATFAYRRSRPSSITRRTNDRIQITRDPRFFTFDKEDFKWRYMTCTRLWLKKNRNYNPRIVLFHSFVAQCICVFMHR